MVGALHRDLLEQTGSPGALQAALRGNNATVTTAITAAITTLLTAADATPKVSPTMPEQEEKGERITPPEELISQEECRMDLRCRTLLHWAGQRVSPWTFHRRRSREKEYAASSAGCGRS
ncbi:hypothetical protein SKAU_G00235140 [Synaphobranchus kaupii]|uniref:Uncharacterized protein n=1 Tax=Synaphobranchus kaupii TaxID=118154 RepID=A0A9Q1F6H1_SYNKA|nr:hypothetical protein SKAU_G00235140 [Synaphobranchus kaupii]